MIETPKNPEDITRNEIIDLLAKRKGPMTAEIEDLLNLTPEEEEEVQRKRDENFKKSL